MKKTYTKRQILEAIGYWEKKLSETGDSGEPEDLRDLVGGEVLAEDTERKLVKITSADDLAQLDVRAFGRKVKNELYPAALPFANGRYDWKRYNTARAVVSSGSIYAVVTHDHIYSAHAVAKPHWNDLWSDEDNIYASYAEIVGSSDAVRRALEEACSEDLGLAQSTCKTLLRDAGQRR